MDQFYYIRICFIITVPNLNHFWNNFDIVLNNYIRSNTCGVYLQNWKETEDFNKMEILYYNIVNYPHDYLGTISCCFILHWDYYVRLFQDKFFSFHSFRNFLYWLIGIPIEFSVSSSSFTFLLECWALRKVNSQSK